MPATVEDAEKVSPAFRAFMAPAHAEHPEVVTNWDYELGLVDYLRQCIAGRVHSRGSIRQMYQWAKADDGTYELTGIRFDADLADNEDATGAVHSPLAPEEMQLVQSCTDHWSRIGSRRTDHAVLTTTRTFPLETDLTYRIVRDGHF